MILVPIEPELLRWARERAGKSEEDLVTRFKKLSEWESGEAQPTLKQVEAFARAVHVPVGYLFLSEPPDEPVPIPDFRTFAGQAISRPSPNLLDTIYTCQDRQGWYREYARVDGQPERTFVGSATIDTPAEVVAGEMQDSLGFDLSARRNCSTWTDALRLFIQHVDDTGVLLMVSGVVMSNNHRQLDPMEFRGFCLSDPLAPLIFVNGADTKAAQIFTLAHELAHLWLGDTALSNAGVETLEGRSEEIWCNAVAAEFLVPLNALRANLRDGESLTDSLQRLARTFKVSTLVALRRLFDVGRLDRANFDTAWREEVERLRALNRESGGGDFYRTTSARVSRRFARALVVSTIEGQTLYRDAFRMLGISKTSTFNNLRRVVGVIG